MSGTVLRWDQEVGALHLRKESGSEVIVPVTSATEIRVSYEDIVSGDLFQEGDQIRVSQESDGPLLVEVVPRPDPAVEDEPLHEPIRDEMEGVAEPVPNPTPTPEAQTEPELDTTSAETAPDVASPVPAQSPDGNEN